MASKNVAPFVIEVVAIDPDNFYEESDYSCESDSDESIELDFINFTSDEVAFLKDVDIHAYVTDQSDCQKPVSEPDSEPVSEPVLENDYLLFDGDNEKLNEKNKEKASSTTRDVQDAKPPLLYGRKNTEKRNEKVSATERKDVKPAKVNELKAISMLMKADKRKNEKHGNKENEKPKSKNISKEKNPVLHEFAKAILASMVVTQKKPNLEKRRNSGIRRVPHFQENPRPFQTYLEYKKEKEELAKKSQQLSAPEAAKDTLLPKLEKLETGPCTSMDNSAPTTSTNGNKRKITIEQYRKRKRSEQSSCNGSEGASTSVTKKRITLDEYLKRRVKA